MKAKTTGFAYGGYMGSERKRNKRVTLRFLAWNWRSSFENGSNNSMFEGPQ